MSTAVICNAPISRAEEIVDTSRKTGHPSGSVSVLIADKQGHRDFDFNNSATTPEGPIGTTGGSAVIGGCLGWLAGIALLSFNRQILGSAHLSPPGQF